MGKRYFGTDGIRGRVGEAPMTADFILKLGWAAGRALAAESDVSGVVIGKDTRVSGYMFESALEAGFSAAGVHVSLLGPMPTPAIAYLTRTFRARAGVVISASHNPFYDNGIKFFSAEGQKLPDAIEERIEALIGEPMETVAPKSLGRARRVEDAAGRYIEFCKGAFPRTHSLSGMRLVVDCAHGATYHVAPHVFRELGAEVIAIGNQPDGLNINQGYGSTDVAALQRTVVEQGAAAGIALDGDGDRCLMVDDRGQLVDGDQMLYIIACARHAQGVLHGPVVGTVMSNLGLELALERAGIGFERVPVGDRYVLERLRERNGLLGGEPSGHIVCLDRTTTGDGIVSALQVLETMAVTGQSLRRLALDVAKCPQVLINVEVARRSSALLDCEHVRGAVADVEASLGGEGRVLLRASGTEPLIRVMVEGMDEGYVREYAHRIADAVKRAARPSGD